VGDRDAEEVVEAAHVRHGELGAEGGGDPVEEAVRMSSTYIKRKAVPSAH
jgi:hypothetical protein